MNKLLGAISGGFAVTFTIIAWQLLYIVAVGNIPAEYSYGVISMLAMLLQMIAAMLGMFALDEWEKDDA